MEEYIKDFLVETLEALAVLDNDLVRLEAEPNNASRISSIFRTLHTVKGTCGFLGLTQLGKVAHAGENVLGRMRDGALSPTPEVISAVLRCIDAIKDITATLESTGQEAAAMTDVQAFRFILRPGFSTAAAVTAISGRGVGMDVVRTNIERIGGTIDIESKVGAGSTFTIKIPLTLAIVPALIVGCAGERFAVPQISVVELVRASDTSEHRIEQISDTAVQVRVLPLGVSVPMYAGSVGPVSGFGCAANPADATADAIQQIKIKALQMRATAVIDVSISSAAGTACSYGFGAHAAGIAVAARGVPSSF